MNDTAAPTTPPEHPVLLTGGTGKTGRRVAERLERLGWPVRIGSRRADPPFDWDEPRTWAAALDGVSAVYVTYAPDIAFPGGPEAVDALVRQAVDAGVRRVVLLSGRGEDEAVRAEDLVRASGADWTIVRCALFAQNFDEGFFVESIHQGVLALPAGDVAEPILDVDDIADVVTAALTDDRHVGRLYELTGPRLLTFAEAVAEIGAATGRDLRYLPITADEFRAELLGAGLPEHEAAGLTDLFSTIFDGRNQSVADGVTQALGRPARDFADYARRVAATGVWDAQPVA
jgi:uncharacterized protein YbjT (DUF2867 family)